ncbi:MAG: hypothetical protein R2828_08180 [Saprospiraceae bacterium]
MRNQYLQKILFLLVLSVSFSVSHAQKMTFEETLFNVKEVMSTSDESAASNRAQVKLDAALTGFLDTDFMKKFKSVKLEAESLVATFKAHEQSFAPADVTRVRKSYTAIADKFNLQLRAIKLAFLDQKQLKMIQKYPQMYSSALENDLRELQEEYSQTFEREVADVTGSDVYAAGPLLAIFGIIKLAVEFTDYLTRVRYDAKRLKEEHLDMYFIEPFHFRRWEEIETGSGDIYKTKKNEEEENLEEETHGQGLNPFGDPKPKKKNN